MFKGCETAMVVRGAVVCSSGMLKNGLGCGTDNPCFSQRTW